MTTQPILDYGSWNLVCENFSELGEFPAQLRVIHHRSGAGATQSENASETPPGEWCLGLTIVADVGDAAGSTLIADYDALFSNADLAQYSRSRNVNGSTVHVEYDAYTDDETLVTYLTMKWS